MTFTESIEKLLSAGIREDEGIGAKKKIRMTNEIALIFSISAIIYMVVFATFATPATSYCLFIFEFLFLSVIYFNARYHFSMARMVLILSLYVGITFFRALLGPSSLVDVLFVSILAVPFAITDKSDSYINLIALFCSVSLYGICNFTNLIDHYELDHVSPAIQYPISIFLFAMPFIVMRQCKKEQDSYEEKLKIRTSEVRMINNQLTASNNRLENTVQSLKESMKEREVLLKEIHHRVKNNMQIISSLLNLQSSHIDNQKVKSIFQGSQLRISSMAMVHEMLYRSEDLSRIEFSEYVDNLVPKLVYSLKGVNHNISLEMNVPMISFSIDTAVPLGLIINEIITNSMKHAFDHNREGVIYISIKREKMNKYVLEVGDNGKGISKVKKSNGSGTLGMMLINDLVDQLNGTVKLINNHNNGGVCYLITFMEVRQNSRLPDVTLMQ